MIFQDAVADAQWLGTSRKKKPVQQASPGPIVETTPHPIYFGRSVQEQFVSRVRSFGAHIVEHKNDNIAHVICARNHHIDVSVNGLLAGKNLCTDCYQQYVPRV
jgi:hypothetical protein